jgi:hypothetical protein
MKAQWQKKIDQRKEDIVAFDAAYPPDFIGPRPPRPKHLEFVFLDESYINKNHSLGRTWYDPDHEDGAAVFMKSGKGERLVMLTAITERLGIIDCHLIEAQKGTTNTVNGTLLLFQARKRTGDYHKNMVWQGVLNYIVLFQKLCTHPCTHLPPS